MYRANVCKRFFAEMLIIRMMEMPVEAKRQMAHRASAALKPVARPAELHPVGVSLADSVVVGWAATAFQLTTFRLAKQIACAAVSPLALNGIRSVYSHQFRRLFGLKDTATPSYQPSTAN